MIWKTRSWGAEAGEPLLLLHGFTWDGSLWAPVVEAMGPTWHATAVDLPGHGGSGWPPEPTFVGVAQAIATLARNLSDAGSTLVGYSLGARLALQAALIAPEAFSRLVFGGGTAVIADPAERERRVEQDAALAADLRQHGLERFVTSWEAKPLFATQDRLRPETRLALRQVRLSQDPEGLARSLEILGQGRMPSLRERLPELKLPVLLVVGAADAAYTGIAEQMHDALPTSDLVVVPGSGHAIPLEAPLALALAIRKFSRQ